MNTKISINNDIFIGDHIYIPKQIKIEYSNIFLYFDELLDNDIELLQRVLNLIMKEYDTDDDYIIVFDKDIVIVLLIVYGDNNKILLMMDRDNGKVILKNNYEELNTLDIRNLVETLSFNKVWVIISDGEIFLTPDYKNIEYNTTFGFRKYMRYFEKMIKKNISYCDYNEFNVIFRVSSHYGTIEPFYIEVIEYGKNTRTQTPYNFVKPSILCEFIHNVLVRNNTIFSTRLLPYFISGTVINNTTLYNPMGKFDVKSSHTRTSNVSFSRIITDKLDKEYNNHKLLYSNELIDIRNFNSLSSFTGNNLDTFDIVTRNNTLQYVKMENIISYNELLRLINIFEVVFETNVKYDDIMKSFHEKNLIRVLNILSRITS